MVVIAAVLAALAAAGWIREPSDVRRIDASPDRPRQRRPRRLLAVAALVVAVGIGGSAIAAGHRGVVIAAAVLVGGGTALFLLADRRRQARARKRRGDVAQACSALAGLVTAGRVPTEALADVAADWPVLAEGATTAALGGDPAAVWLREAQQAGCAGLSDLARGWRLAARTGAPLTQVLDGVAEALRSDADVRLTIESELASTRATGRLLAALPLMGLLLGFGFGGDPVAFLLDQPVGWGCAVGATVLASAGVIWVERLADGAEAW